MDQVYCRRMRFQQRLLCFCGCVVIGALYLVLKYTLSQSVLWSHLIYIQHPVEVFRKQPQTQETPLSNALQLSVHIRPRTPDDRFHTTSKVSPLMAANVHPLTSSQHRPLNSSQHRPLNSSQHRPLNSSQHRPLNSSQHRPLNSSQHRPLNSSQHRPLNSSEIGTVRLICHRFSGQLGNLLFQYASILGISYATKRIPVFRRTEVVTFLLQPSALVRGQREDFQERCMHAEKRIEMSCCFLDENIMNLNPEIDYDISTYLQSWRYFEKHKQQILKDIRFKDATVREAEKIVAYLRKRYPGSELIGVHVRKGDFESQKNKDLGYVTATPDYINRALAYFRKRYPQAVFVVASVNLTWCQKIIRRDFNVTYLRRRSAEVDLTILSKLDHIVITTGTFSWWAGYMNPGETVYFKDFILPETFIGRQYKPNGEDYIYPEWIPL